jgi:hypothetical protein
VGGENDVGPRDELALVIVDCDISVTGLGVVGSGSGVHHGERTEHATSQHFITREEEMNSVRLWCIRCFCGEPTSNALSATELALHQP